jgi:hypothetical protein
MKPMRELLNIIVIPIAVAFLSAIMFFYFARSRRMMKQWARKNGYEIIAWKGCFFRLGPFTWRTSRNQQVYFVTVRTPDGQIRRAWVRCGGWLLGALTNKVDTEWDE